MGFSLSYALLGCNNLVFLWEKINVLRVCFGFWSAKINFRTKSNDDIYSAWFDLVRKSDSHKFSVRFRSMTEQIVRWSSI